MRVISHLAALSFFLSLPIALLAEAPFPAERYLVHKDAEIAGQPLDHYAIDWWQWAYSMQQDRSPVHDRSGVYCHVNQSGEVWYLAGGFGTSIISRNCTVPAGRHLFFPIINAVHYTPPEANWSCDAVHNAVTSAFQSYVHLNVTLNGTKIDPTKVLRLSPLACFDLLAKVPAEFEAPNLFPSAADGFWMMLRPLAPGTHSLSFKAINTLSPENNRNVVQDITYTLQVAPES